MVGPRDYNGPEVLRATAEALWREVDKAAQYALLHVAFDVVFGGKAVSQSDLRLMNKYNEPNNFISNCICMHFNRHVRRYVVAKQAA